MAEKQYEIWSEGYVATGERAQAFYHGIGYGTTFQEACDNFFGDNETYSSHNLSYWACKLFDNGTDARRSFG